MLYYASDLTTGMNKGLFASAMTIIYGGLSFFIPSSSGMAVLTMPIMAPLADTVGIGREIIVGSRVVGWWGALASSIVFGLAFSTVLTLIFTPAALVIPSRIKAWMQNRYDLFKPTS